MAALGKSWSLLRCNNAWFQSLLPTWLLTIKSTKCEEFSQFNVSLPINSRVDVALTYLILLPCWGCWGYLVHIAKCPNYGMSDCGT